MNKDGFQSSGSITANEEILTIITHLLILSCFAGNYYHAIRSPGPVNRRVGSFKYLYLTDGFRGNSVNLTGYYPVDHKKRLSTDIKRIGSPDLY